MKHRNDKYIGFYKLSNLTSPIDYADIKANPELKDKEFLVSPNGSLFKLTDEEFDVIMDMISESNDSNLKKETPLPYKEKDFLNEVFYVRKRPAYIGISIKEHHPTGCSGQGKTFSARRLAYKMMRQKMTGEYE